MTSSTMPTNAPDWARFLVDKPLPSPFRVGKLVLRAMEKKNLPYLKIAEQINNDPVLSYYIMNTANKGRPQGNATSKTLDHAISMIGTEELETTIKNLPFQDSSSEDIKSFYYVRALSSSLYAAYLGKTISEQKKTGNSEDIFWSSLFIGVPIWYLWRFATPEMRLIRYAIRSNFKLPEVAEREVLGCSIQELSCELVNNLELPDLVNACYKTENQPTFKQIIELSRSVKPDGRIIRPDNRELKMHIQQPHFVVMLANMVAHFATHDWYSRACLRSQKVLATYLNISLDHAIRLTHEAAANMSRAHPMPGVMLPAAKLFLDPRKRVKAGTPEKPSRESSQEVTNPRDSVKTKPHQAAQVPVAEPANSSNELPVNPIFNELTSIMINKPDEFVDLHELMNAATQGVAYGLDIKRAMVSLISKDACRLKTYYSVGCREQSEMTTFETTLVKNTIFAKLAERPASIWVKPSSNEKVTNLIPMNFKQVIEVDEYFLMSVFVNKKPVAIFYADNFFDSPLTETQYKQFKYLCGAVTNALQHQASTKAKNKKA